MNVLTSYRIYQKNVKLICETCICSCKFWNNSTYLLKRTFHECFDSVYKESLLFRKKFPQLFGNLMSR